MLVRLSQTLRQYATGWLVLVLFALTLSFEGLIFPALDKLITSAGASPLDLLFFYTPQQAYERIAAYGETGRAAYRITELTADVLYPTVYSLFLGLLISWLFRRGFESQASIQRLNVTPLGAWLFDLLENLGIVTMLTIYPDTPAWLAWLTAVFTMTKWCFAGASILLALVGAAAAIGKSRRANL
ncbi:MAG: hypothetical protein ACOY16_09610 [Chloroflexota bacterium]